eukprot:TRINITY_DN952_c1_g1_i1.p1 TRINITY_DN952_c1_g1~~TRINITY_DN952_c1_g1_i1.p1  ORF type:complete len:686 (+),score=69.49 TRINITY_DN952_c1_g1_i1:232-2289(+)
MAEGIDPLCGDAASAAPDDEAGYTGRPVSELAMSLSAAVQMGEQLEMQVLEARFRASGAVDECAAYATLEEGWGRLLLSCEHYRQCRWLAACGDFEDHHRTNVCTQESREYQQIVGRFLQGVVPRFQNAQKGAVVRSAPSVDSRKTLRQLREGAEVQVEEVMGNWVRISVPMKGWVWRTHLTPSTKPEHLHQDGPVLPECADAPPTVAACSTCGQWHQLACGAAHTGTPPGSCRSCGSNRAESVESTLASSALAFPSWSPSGWSASASLAELTPGPSRRSFHGPPGSLEEDFTGLPGYPASATAAAAATFVAAAQNRRSSTDPGTFACRPGLQINVRGEMPLPAAAVAVTAPPTEVDSDEDDRDKSLKAQTLPSRSAPARPRLDNLISHQQQTAGAAPLAEGDAVEVRDYPAEPWVRATVAKVVGGRVLVHREGYAGMTHWSLIRRQDYSIFTGDGKLHKTVTPMFNRACTKGTERVFEIQRDKPKLGFEFTDETLTINEVKTDSAAERAGLQVGMRIVAVDGTQVWCAADMIVALRRTQNTTKCTLTVIVPISPAAGATGTATPSTSTLLSPHTARRQSVSTLGTPVMQSGLPHSDVSPTGSPISPTSTCGSNACVCPTAACVMRGDGYAMLLPSKTAGVSSPPLTDLDCLLHGTRRRLVVALWAARRAHSLWGSEAAGIVRFW